MSARQSDGWPHSRRTGAFERQLRDTLFELVGEQTLNAAPLVLACSGGPDSTALLVASARTLGGAQVVAAHLDHEMRSAPERQADRSFLGGIAERLGVQCAVGSVAERLTSEESARTARYRWLAGSCRELGASFCATGHTEDDQAETVLLRLTRGAGLDGVASMRPRAAWPVPAEDFTEPTLELLRPLLGRSRGEIESYLGALGIEARDDATNTDTSFARNRMRRRVVPELRAINPAATQHLAAFARRAGDDAAVLRRLGRREFERIGGCEGSAARLDRRKLAGLEAGLAAHVLCAAAAAVGLELDAGQRLATLALATRRGAAVSLRGGRAWSDERWIWIKPKNLAKAVDGSGLRSVT